MAKGLRNKTTDRTTPDATETKSADHSSASSVSESTGVDHASDRLVGLTSCLSPEELIDHQPENEATRTLPEPPPVSSVVVQRYEGEMHNDRMHGQGVAHFQGGNVYKGAFCEGLMQGSGLFTWSDGVTYEGEFVANVPMGHGKYTWLDGSWYEGDVAHAVRHGAGTHRCARTAVTYRGQWRRGSRQGKGVIYYNRQETSWYNGDWEGNKRQGRGVRRYPSGNVYEGEWRDDSRHGEGTMRWLTLGEQYTGSWRYGVQHGQGTHTWFVRRAPGSQYPSRNWYQGAFVQGERTGQGCFCYASGETYQGEWKRNQKHGRGRYTFTNGRSIEREFADDHMVELPPSGLGGSTGPGPLHGPCGGPTHRLPGHGHASTLGPYMELDIDFLLETLPGSRRPSEYRQVEFVVLRHVTELRSIYSFYSRLGHAVSPDNVFLLTRLQYWRLLLDCKVHHHGSTLAQLDRLVPGDKPPEETVSPYTGILLPRLISSLVSIAYHTYHQVLGSQKNILSECFSRLMQDDVLPNAKTVKGFLFSNAGRASVAMSYVEGCWRIYEAKAGPTMTCRQLLLMLKDLNMMDTKLTSRKLLEVITAEDPDSSNLSFCNLEQEVTFLEFLEVLLGCADVLMCGGADPPPRARPGPDNSHPNQTTSVAVDSPPPTPALHSQTDAAKVKSLSCIEDSSSKSEMEKSTEALNSSSSMKSEVGIKDHTAVGGKAGAHHVCSTGVSVATRQASAPESVHRLADEASRPPEAAESQVGQTETDPCIQRTRLFFSQRLFPAHELGLRLHQEVQEERRRQEARRRGALAEAQERARQREEKLMAEEQQEEKRREEEEEKRQREEVEEAGAEDEVGGPSPGALTPGASSSSLAPTSKRKKQLMAKGGL